MDDLPFVAIGFEFARNRPHLPDRQAPLRPAWVVEIDEADGVAVAVGGKHALRPAPRTAFASLERLQVEDHVAVEQVGARGRRAHPLDCAGRQMVQQVDEAAEAELFQQLGDLRPDAFQRLHLGEQRVEDFGPHDAF
jgi:hypothetical protein